MAKSIRGNRDGINGSNKTYTITKRGVVSRKKIVKEIELGKHPNHSIYTRNKEKYVRANPDTILNNNVNKS